MTALLVDLITEERALVAALLPMVEADEVLPPTTVFTILVLSDLATDEAALFAAF